MPPMSPAYAAAVERGAFSRAAELPILLATRRHGDAAAAATLAAVADAADTLMSRCRRGARQRYCRLLLLRYVIRADADRLFRHLLPRCRCFAAIFRRC